MLLLAVAIVCLLLSVLYLLFVSRPDMLRAAITANLHAAFAAPVVLDGIHTGWQQGPVLQFQNLQVGSGTRPLLALREVHLRLYVLPLLWGELMARDLSVTRGSLQLRQNATGHWQVAGLQSSHGYTPALLNLDRAQLQIRHFKITLQTATTKAPLIFHIHGHSSGGLRPLLHWHLRWAKGGSLRYDGTAQGIFTRPGRSSGNGQWSVHNLPLSWLPIVNMHLPVMQGNVVAHGTLVWKSGMPRYARTRFSVDHLHCAGHSQARLTGQWQWQGSATAGQLKLQDLRGLADKPLSAQLHMHWQKRLQGRFTTNWVPALLLRDVPTRYLPAALRAWSRQPWQGSLQNLQFSFAQGSKKQGWNWNLHTNLHDLGVPAEGKWPGLEGLDGNLEMKPEQFSLLLHSPRLAVLWPGYIVKPWLLQKVSGRMSGLRKNGQWSLQAAPLVVNGPGHLQVRAFLSGPHLQLQAQLHDLPVQDIATFVPEKGLNPALQRWLTEAFQSGTLAQAHLHWSGPWQHGPHDPAGAQISLQAHFRNVRLHYAPHWPEATHLDARLQWTGAHLRVSSQHGEIAGVPVAAVSVSLEDVGAVHTPPLRVEINTPLALKQLLPWLRQTPLLPEKNRTAVPLQITGAGQLHLTLVVPFDGQKTQVQGVLDLRRAGMAWSGWRAQSVTGPIDFQRDALHAKNLQGLLQGGPMQFSLRAEHLEGHPDMQLQLRGTLQAQHLPLPERWQAHVQGVIPYMGQGTWKNGMLQLQGEAHLQRSRSTLPAPLRWDYTQAGTVKISGRGSRRNGFDLTVRAPLGSALLRWGGANQHWQWRAGALRLGKGPIPRLPDNGLRVDGGGAELPVDAWSTLLRRSSGGVSLPTTRFDLYWREVRIMGQVWQGTHIQGSHKGEHWHLLWHSPQAAGNLVYEAARAPTLPAKVRVHFQKLEIARPQRVQQTSSDKGSDQGSTLSSAPDWGAGKPLDLQILIDRLIWEGHPAQQVRLEAVRSAQGWKIAALRGIWAGSDWNFSGAWQVRGVESTQFQGEVRSDNIAPALEAVGMNSLEYGHAVYSGKLSWPGAPWDFSLDKLSGTIHSRLKNGRLKKMGTDVAWLVFLNPTTLLKDLLTFDYRPLFGSGLFFNHLSANFNLKNGFARSSDIYLDASALAMHGSGSLDLLQHTMNLDLQVYPLQSFDLLLGHFPLLGPALFGRSGKVLELHYRAEGSWEHPLVTRISAAADKDK